MDNYLTFSLGPSTLGMEIGAAVEVVTPRGVKPVPDVPEHIAGVMKIRRELIPLIDMRVRLSVSPEPKKERAIIVRSVAGKVGLLVDEVFGIRKFEKGGLRKPPVIFRGLRRKYLAGLYGDGEDMIVVLDMDEILTSEEKLILEGLIKKGSVTPGRKKKGSVTPGRKKKAGKGKA